MIVLSGRMKHLVALLASLGLASAAPTAQDALRGGLREDLATLDAVSEIDRALVVSAAARLLERHLAFLPEGRAAAVYQAGESQWEIEWRDLTIRHIAPLPILPGDAANGVTARFRAHLTSTSHRRRALADLAWSDWRATDYGRFPTWLDIAFTSTGPVAEAPATLRGFHPLPQAGSVASLATPVFTHRR